MVTKVTYVGEGFTRKPPKYERFIRPMALRFKKAHVTHPEVREEAIHRYSAVCLVSRLCS